MSPCKQSRSSLVLLLFYYTFHSLAIRDVNVYSACGTVEFSAMDIIVLS